MAQYGTVRGQLLVADQKNARPHPARGRVLFTPVYAKLGTEATLAPFTVEATLDREGKFQIRLVATNTPGVQPEGWTYTVSYKIEGATIPVHGLEVPANATTDLTEAAPLPIDKGTVIVYTDEARLAAEAAADRAEFTADNLPAQVDAWISDHAAELKGEPGEPGPEGPEGPYGGTEVTDPQVASLLAPGFETRAALDAYTRHRDARFNVKDFGAVGDLIADDLPAFDAAYAAVVANGGGTIYIPAGRYRFADEWMIWRANSPRIDVVIEGEDQLTTFLFSDFYGAGKALINGRSPEGVRSSPTSLRNLQIRATNQAGPNPCLVDLDFWSEARMDHVRFATANGTHLRGSSLQNIRAYDVVSYYGGKNYPYRSTDGITFTVDDEARTITADTDIFQVQDEGMWFFIIPTNDTRRIMYHLGHFIDARTIQIAPDTTIANEVLPQAAARGGFDAAHASMMTGSDILTANAPCFTQDDVGRVLIVRNARQGAFGSALLRGTVVEVLSPSSVRLDHTASRTVAAEPFAQPVVDFYTPDLPGRAGSSTTDVKLTNLHMEAYAGLALGVIDALQFHVVNQKLHGEHDPVDARTSTGMAWLDDVGGTFSGELDGQSTSDVRMHFSNMNDTLVIPFLSTRRVRNEILFQVEDMTEGGALIEMGTLVVYRDDSDGPKDFVIDRSHEAGHGRRIAYTGPVTMVGGTVQPRIYSGMGTWFDTSGDMTMTSPNGTEYRIMVGNDGTITTIPA